MARVEEMEKALTSRLVNDQDGTSILPPIGHTKTDDSQEVKQVDIAREQRRDSIGEERLDELQSQVRAARSDNIILRQDLQSLHDRESQLMRRNRDLEDKLLRHRTAESAEMDKKVVNDKAELDLNIDFTMPGKAVISERDPQKVEKKVATVPPLEKASFDSDSWKVTVTSKHKLAALTDKPKTVVVSPLPKPEGKIAPVEPRRQENDTIVMTTTTRQAAQMPKKKSETAEIAKREKRPERRPKKIETRRSVRQPLPSAMPQKLPATKVY